MDILNLIPYGRENAISRQDLIALTGWDGRKVRTEIKKLVRNGEAILSTCGKSGYWRSNDVNEIEQFIRESDHRRTTEALTVEPLRRRVAQAKGLDIVPVKAHYRRLHKPLEPVRQIDGQMTL